eukprot:6185814-Pleurochrysis_carterae.AAC.9
MRQTVGKGGQINHVCCAAARSLLTASSDFSVVDSKLPIQKGNEFRRHFSCGGVGPWSVARTVEVEAAEGAARGEGVCEGVRALGA